MRRILAPLARLLVRQGVPLPWLVEEMKQQYVRAALKAYPEGERVTLSRLNLMTGIQRPEIKRIRNQSEAKVSASVHPVALLVALWMADAVDKNGAPLPLPRSPGEGEGWCFFDLADRATHQNVAPATFLAECIERGVVEHDIDTDEVYLRRQSFVPAKSTTDKLHFLGENTGDHLAASVENVLSDTPLYFDRSVLYKNLSEEDALALDAMAREEGMQLLLRLNKEARRRVKSGRKGKHRFNVGLFSFFRRKDT